MALRKFRVLEGTHTEGNRKFTKNQIVSSTDDLAAMFRLKFVEVDDDIKSDKGAVVLTIGQAQLPAEQAPAAPITLERPAPIVPTAPPVVVPAADRGLDVSKRFAYALEQDFSVFKRDGVYFIYNNDAPTVQINKDGVAKAAVDAIIKEEVE